MSSIRTMNGRRRAAMGPPPVCVRTVQGARRRVPASPDLPPLQRRILATLRLRHPGTANASDLAGDLAVTVWEVRRALADLRELRLVSTDRQPGTSGNVWSAVL